MIALRNKIIKMCMFYSMIMCTDNQVLDGFFFELYNQTVEVSEKIITNFTICAHDLCIIEYSKTVDMILGQLTFLEYLLRQIALLQITHYAYQESKNNLLDMLMHLDQNCMEFVRQFAYDPRTLCIQHSMQRVIGLARHYLIPNQ